MKSVSKVMCVLGVVGTASVTLALPVSEGETPGTIQNNTTGTAQSVNGFFSANVNPDVFGNLPTATVSGLGGTDDVDFYSFSAGAGIAYFDIDNTPFTFDSILSLFDSNGTLLAFDDDTDPDAGSESGLDSFLGTFTLPAAGTYYLAVSQFSNFANTAFNATQFTELFRPDGQFGGIAVGDAAFGDSSFFASDVGGSEGYTLHISVENAGVAIPLPSAAGLGLAGLLGLGAASRRRLN